MTSPPEQLTLREQQYVAVAAVTDLLERMGSGELVIWTRGDMTKTELTLVQKSGDRMVELTLLQEGRGRERYKVRVVDSGIDVAQSTFFPPNIIPSDSKTYEQIQALLVRGLQAAEIGFLVSLQKPTQPSGAEGLSV
jgi:hypothetical protein